MSQTIPIGLPWVELARRAKAKRLAPTDSAEELLRRYDEVDAQLVSAGWPETSPWWREQIGTCWSRRRRRWVFRVGRRGGKSSSLCRVAVVWALYGNWSVPPGDVAVIPFVSVDRTEAAGRIDTIRQMLTVLGVTFAQRNDEIEIGQAERRVIFRVKACTVTSVSGFTAIAAFCDEVAKWRTRETGANPASEVVTSLSPTLATQPNGFLVLSSSPWTKTDYHAREFDRGDTDNQVTAAAPTWVANPTISEQLTHELEPDDLTRLREYGIQPSDGVVNDWFGRAIDAAIRTDPAPQHWGTRYIIAIDAAFKNDLFGWAVVASHKEPSGKRVTWVHASGAWDPDSFQSKPSLAAARLKSELCDKYGTTYVFADQHEGSSFTELARQAGITLEIVPWLGSSAKEGKTERFRAVRTGMLEGAICLPNDPDLHSEMRRFEGIYANGSERVNYVETEGVPGHGDRVSALVLACSIALSRGAQDVQTEPPKPGSPEWQALEQQRMRQAAIEASKKRQREAAKRMGF
ncbi:MAG: hypothetical protein EPO32_14670 [Anaerolineae bacterium]|nr:MAG: hypothetical protein EPO32_14670 [Anaerolineae bacterium]